MEGAQWEQCGKGMGSRRQKGATLMGLLHLYSTDSLGTAVPGSVLVTLRPSY